MRKVRAVAGGSSGFHLVLELFGGGPKMCGLQRDRQQSQAC
jgi:hypothetical protein